MGGIWRWEGGIECGEGVFAIRWFWCLLIDVENDVRNWEPSGR